MPTHKMVPVLTSWRVIATMPSITDEEILEACPVQREVQSDLSTALEEDHRLPRFHVTSYLSPGSYSLMQYISQTIVRDCYEPRSILEIEQSASQKVEMSRLSGCYSISYKRRNPRFFTKKSGTLQEMNNQSMVRLWLFTRVAVITERNSLP